MPKNDSFKAHCPQCDGERQCLVLGEKIKEWESGDHIHSMWGRNTFKLLECMGCETVFYYKSSINSEDYEHDYDSERKTVLIPNITIVTFPKPSKVKSRPEWLHSLLVKDMQLHTIFNEMYAAYESGSFILASIGLRTIFDRATEVLKIHPGLPLKEKVNILKEEGFIGETEKSQLEIVTEAGNSAAHRAWTPKESEFESLLIIIESFVQRNVLRDDRVYNIAEMLPKKAPRKPKN